jgi:hypothetical protein
MPAYAPCCFVRSAKNFLKQFGGDGVVFAQNVYGEEPFEEEQMRAMEKSSGCDRKLIPAHRTAAADLKRRISTMRPPPHRLQAIPRGQRTPSSISSTSLGETCSRKKRRIGVCRILIRLQDDSVGRALPSSNQISANTRIAASLDNASFIRQ